MRIDGRELADIADGRFCEDKTVNQGSAAEEAIFPSAWLGA